MARYTDIVGPLSIKESMAASMEILDRLSEMLSLARFLRFSVLTGVSEDLFTAAQSSQAFYASQSCLVFLRIYLQLHDLSQAF